VLKEEQCPVMLFTAPHYNLLQHAAIYIEEFTLFVAFQGLDEVGFVDFAIVQELCVCLIFRKFGKDGERHTIALPCEHTQN